MINYKNDKLTLQNSEGLTSEFSKCQLSIPLSLTKFSYTENFDLSKSSQPPMHTIHCSSVGVQLDEFSRSYQDSTDDEDYELSDEIEYEFKVLSEMSRIDRVKTDSQLLSAQIKPENLDSKNYISLKRQGFFTIVTVHIFLPQEIFNNLGGSTKSGSLNRIDTVMHIDGFNLGHELGKGNSGVLIENEQNFNLRSLSTNLSGPHDKVLSALNRIERRIAQNTEKENE